MYHAPRATGTRKPPRPAAWRRLQMSVLGYEVHVGGFEGLAVPQHRLAGWEEPGIRNYYFYLPPGPTPPAAGRQQRNRYFPPDSV